jgi:hypothetical protein
MTITPKPEQERVLTEAIEAGLIQSPEDALDIALQELQTKLGAAPPAEPRRMAEGVQCLDKQPFDVHSFAL